MTCSIELCDNIAERSGLCASHAREKRKAEKESLKPKKERKPIAKVSPKRKKDLKVYQNRRKHYLAQYPECQLKLEGCTKIATELHHAGGRIGSMLTNKNHFRSACNSCHRQLHDKLSAKEAREKKLKV